MGKNQELGGLFLQRQGDKASGSWELINQSVISPLFESASKSQGAQAQVVLGSGDLRISCPPADGQNCSEVRDVA